MFISGLGHRLNNTTTVQKFHFDYGKHNADGIEKYA